MSLRAILFDAGNTLVFLDYHRMAQGVSAALGLPLTSEALAAGAPEASRAMEQAAGNDQERAAVYLEALFRLAGIPAERPRGTPIREHIRPYTKSRTSFQSHITSFRSGEWL